MLKQFGDNEQISNEAPISALPIATSNILFLAIPGQQQHFRPFFDTRFTGHLLDFRRKSDPFASSGNEGGVGGTYPLSTDHWGYNNYSYLGYNTGVGMTSPTYQTPSLASYGTAVLDPLLQASSLASAASVQTSSGEQRFHCFLLRLRN